MGMFDEVRSSCQGLVGTFQTKDLSSALWTYYLDPAGRLWSIDYTGTSTMHINEEATSFLGRIKFVGNGNHGKVEPFYITGELNMCRTQTAPDGLQELYQYTLQFVDGVLQSFRIK